MLVYLHLRRSHLLINKINFGELNPMKLIKMTLLASTMGLAINAMANEVTISNTSDHPIPVKYQLAYHNKGKPVVLKSKSETVVYGNKKSYVNVPLNGYNHAGIIILAVKQDIGSTHWHYLPESAKQFDGALGCWMRADAQKRSGNIALSEISHGKHGKINCSTHLNNTVN